MFEGFKKISRVLPWCVMKREGNILGVSEGCMWKLSRGQPVIALTCAQARKCMLVIWGGSTRGKCRETKRGEQMEVSECQAFSLGPNSVPDVTCHTG